MKKLFIVLAVASLGFVACNSNSTTEDQKKMDDSIAAKKVQDSLDALKAMTPVLTPEEMEAKRVADSIAAAVAPSAEKK